MKYIKLYENFHDISYGYSTVNGRKERDNQLIKDVEEISDILSLEYEIERYSVHLNSIKLTHGDLVLGIDPHYQSFVKVTSEYNSKYAFTMSQLFLHIIQLFNLTDDDTISMILTKRPDLYHLLENEELISDKVEDQFSYLKNELF